MGGEVELAPVPEDDDRALKAAGLFDGAGRTHTSESDGISGPLDRVQGEGKMVNALAQPSDGQIARRLFDSEIGAVAIESSEVGYESAHSSQGSLPDSGSLAPTDDAPSTAGSGRSTSLDNSDRSDSQHSLLPSDAMEQGVLPSDEYLRRSRSPDPHPDPDSRPGKPPGHRVSTSGIAIGASIRPPKGSQESSSLNEGTKESRCVSSARPPAPARPPVNVRPTMHHSSAEGNAKALRSVPSNLRRLSLAAEILVETHGSSGSISSDMERENALLSDEFRSWRARRRMSEPGPVSSGGSIDISTGVHE